MAYTKLDSTLTDSTIWQAPDHLRILWITMLSMADQNGYVGASVPGLAGRARIPMQACIDGLATLSSPDEWSRTKDHEGRRIGEADGGWILLNHAKYRAAQNAEDRKERSRVAMASLRHERKQALTVNQYANKLPKLAQAEADTEKEPPIAPKGVRHEPDGFRAFWEAWPKSNRKGGRDKCLSVWRDKLHEGAAQAIVAHVVAMAATKDWTKDGGQYVPAPVVYLRSTAWTGAEFDAPHAQYAGAI